MKTETFLEQKYKLIDNYKDGYEKEAVEHLFTEYFLDYDYVIGDWSYGKLRLKGFCNPENPKCNPKNHIEYKKTYLDTYCAYNCRYFVLQKI